MNFQNSRDFAKSCDQEDKLAKFKSEFHFPKQAKYFCGHSLGLQPKKTAHYVNEVLDDWKNHAVEAHFDVKHSWMPYHELLTPSMAKIVGAKEKEVCVMNTLSVNLHLLMVSFYNPTKERFKIIMEDDAFCSDHYAIDSQVRLHNLDPKECIIKIKPRSGESLLREDDIFKAIDEHHHQLALVLLGNVNYLTGQYYPIQEIVQAAHQVGAKCGFDLAHAVGNYNVKLHQWNVDFACWCNYKFLNAGPGHLGGIFIHEQHLKNKNIKRLQGWWGHNKETRFQMPHDFDPIPTAEAWGLSNPPILPMAAFRASLEIFEEAGIDNIREKSIKLTGFLEFLLLQNCQNKIEIITSSDPQKRGASLCVKVTEQSEDFDKKIRNKGVIIDFRRPNILRLAPAPLYTSFEDVFDLVQTLKECL